ncbi:STAS domain-containing protein [Streptomyces sp. NPDC048248]|uniref:STAS domain-containing protein n=1 Tax=Streptomyces sp. NPDC048248 TaxID=3365523 RepID=UPI00371A58F1
MDEGQDCRGFAGRIHETGAVTVLELCGELDIFAAGKLSERLDDLTGHRRPDLVLDLRAVTFIDCAGLSLLCRARHRARERGGLLRLAGVAESDSVMRLLRLTGVGEDFVIVPDHVVADALRAARRAVPDLAPGRAGVIVGVTDIAGTAVG